MERITTISELRDVVEQTERAMGIANDIRIPIKERVAFIANVADANRRNSEPTHNGVASYLCEVYYIKNLQIACEVLTYQNESIC